MGVDFRDYIFENQPEITPQNLRSYAEKFAAAHKVDLPFVVDPQGKLAAEVNKDKSLGTQWGFSTRRPFMWLAIRHRASRSSR